MGRWILVVGATVVVTFAGYVTYISFSHNAKEKGAAEIAFSGPASHIAPDFVDRTADFGLTVTHRQGDERLTGLNETLGSGACALDYDNDGWIDLFVVNGSGDTRYYGSKHWWQNTGGHRLLKNQGGRQFTDMTVKAGIGAVTQGMGCVAADFDNDGHIDLFVTNIGSNQLFHNNGNGTFTDVAKEAGIDGDSWYTAAAVADVDGDGKLDLYVGGFIAFEKGSHTYEPGSQFKQDNSGFFNSALYPALPNRLFRNLGGMRFQDVTGVAGVTDNDGRTLAALWTDVNDDGKPDLIVVNAAGTGSTTGFLNRGDWHFEPMGIQARIESGLSFRGIALGDLNNDGKAELVLTGASGNQTTLLFRNTAAPGVEPSFVDQARQWQLAKEQYAAYSPWSALPADFNNDGWTDLFIANGQISPDSDAPRVTVGQPKQLWLNGGDSQLHEYKPPPLSPLLDRQSARGLVVADFNNDGKLDVYVAHNNDLGQLLINESSSPNRWLGVKLIDTHGNLDGVGARVSVTTEQGTQVHWVTKGMGFLSDSDPRLHFGLGAALQATITVQWTDGSRVIYRDVPTDGYVTVSPSGDIKRGPAPAKPESTKQSARLVKVVPEIRAEYFRGLTTVGDSMRVVAALREALHDPSEEVRATVVTALGEQRSAERLRLLLRFLEDKNDSVVALAVDAICAYEEESATRFLLRMFAHRSAVVRQHSAACFMRYYQGFRGQQAVIHRKYLAVPYLAVLLADPDTPVRIAAARALGASEKFRGVSPLIDLLNSDTPLQSEAVRALGLIRDKYALPALLKLLIKPRVAPTTYAQLFIALKRLDYDGLDKVLQDFANGRGNFASLGLETRLSTFLEILESAEGVVLARDKIKTLADTAYNDGAHQDKAAISYVRILEKSGAANAASSVIPLLNHSNPQVRAAAYLAGFTLDPSNRATLVSSALRDSDAAVRQSVLQRIAADKVQLPDTLFLEVLPQENTRLAAIAALRGVNSTAVIQMLTNWVQNDAAKKDIKIAALAALSRSNCPLALPEDWYRTVDDDLRIAMFGCEAKRLPAIFVSRTAPPFVQRYLPAATSPTVRQAIFDFLLTREELWARQEVTALLQSMEDPALRQHVLRTLPSKYFPDSRELIKIADNPHDPLRLVALRRLHGTSDPQTIQALLAIARSNKKDRETRILAGAALPVTYGKDVLPSLLNPKAGEALQ